MKDDAGRKPWLIRTNSEDAEEAARKFNDRISDFLDHPSYREEVMEMEAAQRAKMNPERPVTIEDALYAHETHQPSRRMLRWEQRRGLRQEEDFYS